MERDKLLRDKDVQGLLSVSRTYLYRLRREGKIRALRQSGNRIYYLASDVNAYMEALPTANELKVLT